MQQPKHATVQSYLETFQNCVDVISHCGGAIDQEPGFVEPIAKELGIILPLPDGDSRKQVTEAASQRYLALAFLMGADRTRYGKLLEDLENSYLQGRDDYPKTLNEAYTLLMYWRQNPKNYARMMGGITDGVAFTNAEGRSDQQSIVNANAGAKSKRDKADVTCHKCQEKGHYANECTNAKKKDDTNSSQLLNNNASTAEGSSTTYEDPTQSMFQFLQLGWGKEHQVVSLNQPSNPVPDNWILLDNQSTADIFHNRALLQNIRKSTSTMRIHCNAGVASTNLIGDLPGYGTVWFYPSGIANILSLANVMRRYCVTYDSTTGNKFVVHKPDGSCRVFTQSPQGLYYLDASNLTLATTLVTTVAEKKA